MITWRTFTLPIFVFALFVSTVPVSGDDVIIDQSCDQNISLGDFECSCCQASVGNKLTLASQSSSDLTAGELWKFFASQGVDSMENLTLCLDLQPNAQMSNSVGIHSVNFQISDPNGALLTDASLRGNKLVVPDYEITSSKPEAKLEFALGYDFMERFSANSQEKISINFGSTSDASTSPEFAIATANEFLPAKFSLSSMVGFIAFWVSVFLFLNWVTKPPSESTNPATGNASSKQRALSA